MTLSSQISELFGACGEFAEIRSPETWSWMSLSNVRHSQGWLSIEDLEDHWHVMWTSHKDTHDWHGTKQHAVGIDVDKKSGLLRTVGKAGEPFYLSGAWKSAISMWPVREPEAAQEILDAMSARIAAAHKHYIQQPKAVAA